MSLTTPFEVTPCPGGWSWRLIASCGRPLVYSHDPYPTQLAAADAARRARAEYHTRAVLVDGGAGA